MLQDLRLHGRYMRMDNDLWPVVRESARRILKLEHILIKLPHELSFDYKFLCDEISNNIPSRLTFPEVQYGDYEKIEVKLTKPELDYDEILIEIGLDEPDENICWIESDLNQGWKWLLESCSDLLSAGYPGCIGCGGPNSEEPWEEVINRSTRRYSQEKKI